MNTFIDALLRVVKWATGLFALPPTTDTPQPAPIPQTAPDHPVAATVANSTTVEIVARTIWAEARGQGATGMHAVCNVIQNRARNPGWWGRDLRSVCLSPWQFSCWNANDPQAAKLRGPINDPAFITATGIAKRAVAETLTDLTHGADHYYAETIQTPAWAYGRTPTFIWGRPGDRQFFYRVGLTG